MSSASELHTTLAHQLRRMDLTPDVVPSGAAWPALLATISSTYAKTERDRSTLERSIDVSSREMRVMHEELSRQALQDALTGLPNRAAMFQHLERSLGECTRAGHGLAVLFIDLDGFKQVNDSLGHAAGDELLVRASERIRACIRPDDVVARLGGDEFVVVCTRVLDRTTAPVIASRIGRQLETAFRIGEQDAVVSASIGIAVTTDGMTSGDTLLRHADLAMYAAKIAGKSRSMIFDESMQHEVNTKLSVRSALGQAVARRELHLHYQPITSLVDEQMIGVEALVRWERPGHGVLLPDEFIPIAEENSLVSAVDCWVLTEACRQGADWCALGYSLAVNLSARTLETDQVVHTLSQALHQSGIAARRLTLEITETTLLSGSGTARRNLDRMRDLGVRLSIDDFGTGYSSLSQLQRTKVDVLKIDRTFVSAMDEDESSASIVKAIVAMGHALGLVVVAEGVERASQATLLRTQGCDAAQGWLFGRPLPAAEIDTLVRVVPTLSASAAG
ncbi:putative bifunctional diguanylate cyclase/phosphodiesterase [Pengzhenrongella sp.]|jgi:diguanylate cyclase (GGDEF)-like protein|uniref:putative bifunctional diguanylate cyclase/phosphodiesterase n=1 Tax=Pengzhenrongella sp. TaxID=2888820 RepID=UPI002F9323AB